jgi:hypothetical protein
MMRWFFRDDDLMKEEWLRQLFAAMRSALEYDETRFIWIMKRTVRADARIPRNAQANC